MPEPLAVPHPPSLPTALFRGSIGGILLSVAGFAPWAWFGRPLTRWLGEAGFYSVCAFVFIALSAPLLSHLLGGQRRLLRFYGMFVLSFTLYSIGWIAGWMAWRGLTGELIGLVFGCALMATVLVFWFRKPGRVPAVTLLLLAAQVPGYFMGSWVYERLTGMDDGPPFFPTMAKLLWGVFYGWGLGAGLGAALWWLQRPSSAAANSPDDNNS